MYQDMIKKNHLNLREAHVSPAQSQKHYKAISKQFQDHHSIVKKIIHKWKTFNTIASLTRFADISANPLKVSTQRNDKNPKK